MLSFSSHCVRAGQTEQAFVKQGPVVADQLKRCSKHLRKAVAYLSGISGTPQEKLRAMVTKTRFGSIAEDEFPSRPLRFAFHAIADQMGEHTETQRFDSIMVTVDEHARRVIKQICELSKYRWLPPVSCSYHADSPSLEETQVLH